MLWINIWVNPFIVTIPVQMQMGAKFWTRIGVRPILNNFVVVMFEAVIHCNLHFTSILDSYTVFDHLNMLLMGIWVHHYGLNFEKLG
jgi:hypothetical protein